MELPPYQSVVNVDAEMLGEQHWRRVSVGERVKSYHQAFILVPGPTGGWQLSSFCTADKQIVTGRTVYRAPASLRAWLSVAWPVTKKLVRRWMQRKTPST
jgi:hypothetical protein